MLWEERTRQRIKLAAHQRVILDFLMHHGHRRSVIIAPPGIGKSYIALGVGLFMAGHNPGLRSAFVSKTQGQAMKLMKSIGEHIETNDRLHMVFPHLLPSPEGPWTQSKRTIVRPRIGTKDPTFAAYGIHGQIAGSRLNLIFADDLLDNTNTFTEEQRNKDYAWFDYMVQGRLDPKSVSESRLIVSNTALHPKDIVHRLWDGGWPTLRMDIEGGIFVYNPHPDWEPKGLRPRLSGAFSDGAELRLVAHDPDPGHITPLWPAVFTRSEIEERRNAIHPAEFNRAYMSNCRDDSTAECKVAWIEACKREARQMGFFGLRGSPVGSNLPTKSTCLTGVDLAFSMRDRADNTCLFTIEVMPDGRRLILDIDTGKFDAPTIIQKIRDKHAQYGSQIRIENNSAQEFFVQQLLNQNRSLPVYRHTTGANKANPEIGVRALFTEISHGGWLIPNDEKGRCPKNVQTWIDACLYYVPDKHTSDELMASWFAQCQAMETHGRAPKVPGAAEPYTNNPLQTLFGPGVQLTGRR